MEDKQIIDKQQKVINKLVDAKKRVEEHLRDVEKVMVGMRKNEQRYNYLLSTLINGLNSITNKQKRVVIKNEKAVEGIGRFMDHGDMEKDIGAEGREKANQLNKQYEQALSHDMYSIIENTCNDMIKINKLICKELGEDYDYI